MNLSAIEQQVVANLHNLPVNKQQSVLEFSLFLLNSTKNNHSSNDETKQPHSSFAVFVKEFLIEAQLEPLDIDTSIFDGDRPQESGREIEL
jgi:hypothetical protein